MLTITLDGQEIATMGDVHAQIASQARLSPHLGHNLDALWDSLTEDLEGPIKITWKNAGASAQRLGADFGTIRRLLSDAARTRCDLDVEWA